MEDLIAALLPVVIGTGKLVATWVLSSATTEELKQQAEELQRKCAEVAETVEFAIAQRRAERKAALDAASHGQPGQ